MTDPVRRLLWIAVAETAGLVVLIGSFVVAAIRGGTALTSLGSELAVYLVFLAAMVLVCRGLARRRPAARTPFLMCQLFALVAAWLFLGGDVLVTRVAGAALGAVALLGVVLVLSPAVTRELGRTAP